MSCSATERDNTQTVIPMLMLFLRYMLLIDGDFEELSIDPRRQVDQHRHFREAEVKPWLRTGSCWTSHRDDVPKTISVCFKACWHQSTSCEMKEVNSSLTAASTCSLLRLMSKSVGAVSFTSAILTAVSNPGSMGIAVWISFLSAVECEVQ